MSDPDFLPPIPEAAILEDKQDVVDAEFIEETTDEIIPLDEQ
jgi:hypothetical protein